MLTFLTFSPVFADEAVVYVSPDGDNELADGTEENPYQTISLAIEQVNEEGTVKVKQGVYNENVVIDKSLVLEAVDGVDITEISPETGAAITLSAQGATVQDFTLNGEIAVLLGVTTGTENSKLQRNILKGTQYSIATDENTNFDSLVVTENTFYNTFSIENVSNVVNFYTNTFDSSAGLYSANDGVIGSVIGDINNRMIGVNFRGNTVLSGFTNGITVRGTEYVGVFDNTVDTIAKTAFSLEFVRAAVSGNVIDARIQALELSNETDDSSNVNLLTNTFTGNAVDTNPSNGYSAAAVVIKDGFVASKTSNITGNIFKDNKNALYLGSGGDYSSTKFLITQNAFSNTESIAVYNDSATTASLSGNYWDASTGLDTTQTVGVVSAGIWYLDSEMTISSHNIPVIVPAVENATIAITGQRPFEEGMSDSAKEFLAPSYSFSYTGAQTLNITYGSTLTVTLTADEGYQAAIIQDNETTVDPVSEYTLDSVKETHEFVFASGEDTIPVITLNGSEEVDMFTTEIYQESGYTVSDVFDTEVLGLELEVIVTGEVDTEVAGTYRVTYSTTDSAGNAVEKIRTVVVKDNIVQTGGPSGGSYSPPAASTPAPKPEPEVETDPEDTEEDVPAVVEDPIIPVVTPEDKEPAGEVLGEHITESTESRIQTTLEKEQARFTELDINLATRVQGRILLQVEENGEAWYVPTGSTEKFYLADGASAFQALRQFGVGITNEDLAKIPVGVESRFEDIDTDGDGLADKLEEGLQTDPLNADSDEDGVSDGEEVLTYFTNPLGEGILEVDDALINQSLGTIYLQVESRGEAWYVNPADGMRYYMKDGNAAFQIMRFLSLGITNTDLATIEVGELSI